MGGQRGGRRYIEVAIGIGIVDLQPIFEELRIRGYVGFPVYRMCWPWRPGRRGAYGGAQRPKYKRDAGGVCLRVDASISCRDDSSKPILPGKPYVSWVLFYAMLSMKGEAHEQRAWHVVLERIASMNVLKASILCAKRDRIYRQWRSEDKWVLIYVLPPAVST